MKSERGTLRSRTPSRWAYRPPELLFDQGVGDLFVVRVAGNVVGGAGTTVKGSIEYAVAELKVSLVLVLGHSNCGAVKAAVKHLDGTHIKRAVASQSRCNCGLGGIAHGDTVTVQLTLSAC
jgi:carbonic anhydrase